MAWELNAGFTGRYRGQLEGALSLWTPERLAEAIANDDYARNPRLSGNWMRRNERWYREIGFKWFEGRKGYYLRCCPPDALVELVIERIERTATTDNGGWAIWIDQDGVSKIEARELDAGGR